MYEVESKIEITDKERERLFGVFKEKQFPFTKTTLQNDYYTEAAKSQYGGYDLKRYRDEDGVYFYTEKSQEMVNDSVVRRELEHAVSKDELLHAIQEHPPIVTIKKTRAWFAGEYEGQEISITIDNVKFDHSPDVRYFIEAEIGVEEKDKVKETKDTINAFLKELLGISDVIEAPGMFTMAFERK